MIYSVYKLNKQGDNIYPWNTPFLIWNHCFMSSSNCCFLICMQISQEAGKVVWYSHFFKNFPQFVVIHTAKGFGIVDKAEMMFSWNSLAFSMIQWMLAIWSLVPLPLLKPAWTSRSSRFTYCSSPSWRILSTTLLVCKMTWPASWETYMQVRKQQLELHMEQQTGSK